MKAKLRLLDSPRKALLLRQADKIATELETQRELDSVCIVVDMVRRREILEGECRRFDRFPNTIWCTGERSIFVGCSDLLGRLSALSLAQEHRYRKVASQRGEH